MSWEPRGNLTRKLACGGDDCGFCPRYTATFNKNEDNLRDIAILWKPIGWRKHLDPPDTLVCSGCETFTEPCEHNVRACCIEKKIENCGQCTRYPCDTIEKAFELTRTNAETYKHTLSTEEYALFVKAFFSKKHNLDNVNYEFKRASGA